MKQIKLKKADILLILALLLISLFFLFLNSAKEAATVEVSVAGKLYGEYSLNQNRTVEIKTEFGVNILEIKDGKARVIDADCPGGDCMEFSPISKDGEVIACVPHKLSIRAKGGDGIDAVVY